MVHAPDGVPDLPEFLDRALARQAGPAPVPADLPCHGVDAAGLLDLGRDGRAAAAACSTVPFALRSGTEQQALVAGFGRWLNSMTGPAQILIRTHPVDLEPAARRLRHQEMSLPHPALSAAARAHAEHLTNLAEQRELLGRQVLLVAREPGGNPAAGARAQQRITDAIQSLTAADIEARPLTAAETVQALQAACNPEPPAGHDDEGEQEC
jgi:hypothetical protein